MLEIYESDDATLVSDLEFTGLDAGADSDVLELHVWKDKDNGAGQDAANLALALRIEDPANPGNYLATGLPPLDELWARWRIIGYNNGGDATWSVASTDWQPWGAYVLALLGNIPADCAVHIEVLQHPPSSAEELSWRWAVVPIYDAYSAALPQALGLVARGIVHSVGEHGHSGLVRGGAVTATGTPDDEVHIAASEVVWKGRLEGKIVTDITLNQTDGAAGTLASGEAYYAVLTYGASGWHATKGTKAASPVKPTPPAGEILARTPYVLVQYGATGSVIETADLDGEGLYDRCYAEAGSGLQVKIHPGRSLGVGTYRYSSAAHLVSVEASTTNYLWQLASGLWDATTTEVAPETTATGPWFEADTDGSSVTAIRDRRDYAGRSVVLVLKGATPGSPGLVDDLGVEHDRLFVEQIALRASDNGGGSAGSTKGDLRVNGTSIFAGSGTDDQRPEVAYNATTLVDRDGIADGDREIRKGDVLSFYTVAHPTGGNPARLEIHVVCRVP